MILTTGAGGKTGQAVIRALVARREKVRALARRPEQAAALQDAGVADIVIEDLLDEVGMVRAMAGVKAVYLIAPNVHPEEDRIGEIAITAARTAGVKRLAYHSVLHPQTRAMPHHWRKLAVEQRLFESGLDITILQPAAYMQNLLPYWEMLVAEGRYRVPYGEGATLSLVDLEDVAEVAPLHHAHREVGLPLIVAAEFVHRHDTRVLELPGDLCLVEKALQILGGNVCRARP